MAPVAIKEFPTPAIVQELANSPGGQAVNMSSGFFENTMLLTTVKPGEGSVVNDESMVDGIRIKSNRRSSIVSGSSSKGKPSK